VELRERRGRHYVQLEAGEAMTATEKPTVPCPPMSNAELVYGPGHAKMKRIDRCLIEVAMLDVTIRMNRLAARCGRG
jgi:hypothetical protein